MKKQTIAGITAAMILSVAVLLSGCGSTADALRQTAESQGVSTASVAALTAVTRSDTESELFTSRDLSQEADTDEAAVIVVSDGQTVTITEAGVYVLTGSAKNATVLVEAGEEDKVQLVLDGLSIVNTDQPCILVERADKVFLTSAEGSENSLIVSGQFSSNYDAAVFSRDDLVLNGLGTVTISSTNDGIRSNDDLKLTGGTWNVSATGSAMKAHDSLLASDGTYTLTAGGDGLHAEDNDDDSVGSIVIEGGSFTIQAGDDGIHGTTAVTINGGTLSITAAEGIEATQVILNDGSVSIKAQDDGINAGRKSSSLSVRIEINGGDITIVMGSGDTDGVDSNGDLVITGGTIDISGQSPFDYDGSCTYTGGTIIVNGVETNSVSNQMMGGGMKGGPGRSRW